MGNINELVRYIWNHPANQGYRLRSLARAFFWQCSKRIFGKPWDITLPGGASLRCYPDSPSASQMIYARGCADYAEMHFLRHYLRPGDRFIDVGANIGIYTLLAAPIVGPTGSVDSFEPCGSTLQRLRENVERNHLVNVTIHPIAVGPSESVVRFSTDLDCENKVITDPSTGLKTVEVVCRRLDDVLNNQYALGKIDTEGFEPQAFQGATRLLAERNPPVWLMELAGPKEWDQQFDGFLAWLKERGYDIFVYDPEFRKLCPRAAGQKLYNGFAIAKDRLKEVESRIRGEG